MRTSLVIMLVAVAACGSEPGDITGPFTGPVRRYVVDEITLPETNDQITDFGDDLDGDSSGDNQLGIIYAALVSTHDTTMHAPSMIASGALASTVEIQADDLANDDRAGVTYYGEDGAPAGVMGGRFRAGRFESNRVRSTQHPGTAVVRLPVFADADPIAVPLTAMEIDLAPDPDGGGFDALVRGGIPIAEARAAAYVSVLQMMTNNPTAHLVFARILDANHDGNLTMAEVEDSSLLAAFIVADLHETSSLSVGFRVHLVPCEAGRCQTSPPAAPCFDRVKGGSESDIDCGGSCAKCAATRTCGAPSDCESNACDAGRCRAPSCTDGFRDGFESDVDCGNVGCMKCALGKVCANNTDCASNSCNGAVGSPGVCI